MVLIKNLRIRDKLLVLLVVLLIPLLFFLISGLMQEINEKRNLETVLDALNESEVLSSVLHELQRERAITMVFLASKGRSFANVLESQRQSTDMRINQLRDLKNRDSRLTNELQNLDELTTFRYQIDQLQVDSAQFALFNQGIRRRIIARVQSNADNILDTDIRRQLLSYAHLIQARSQMGVLRTLISHILTVNALNVQEYATLQVLHTIFSDNIREFGRLATPSIQQAYQARLNDPEYQQVMNLINALIRRDNLDLAAMSTEDWFSRFSVAIEQLREVERTNIDETIALMSATITQKERTLFFYLGFVLFMLLIASVLSYYTVTSISNALQLLRVASDKVVRGYSDVVIPIDSTDEIGELANSFRTLVNKNIHLSQVAEAVGEGRYDVEVDVLSEQDVLASSLQRMKNRLQKFSLDNEIRQWHLNGIAQVNDLISGANDINEITRKIVQFLAEYTQSDAGAFYLLDDFEKLHLSAGYALDIPPGSNPTYALGEGVIGQAAASRKTIELPEVPSAYLKIRTALAEVVPYQTLVMPLYFEEYTIGVLELASRRPFNERRIEFLKSAAEKISVMIHSLRVHLRTQELLYETQNQAEELETQHEELRQINLELKTQKEQLQTSEEELKVSQEELEEKNSELEEKTQLLEEQFEAVRTKNREVENARQAIELKVQQLETVSRYKSEFLANMSHELRTPLNSILILSRLMADNTEKNLTKKQQEHAEIIYNSGSDLLKLINEILDLSKIESGQIHLEIREVNPRDIQLRGQFDYLAREKNITFVTEHADDLPPRLQTDQFRLEQILKNLLSNAFKFTPADGKITYRVYPVRQKMAYSHPALQASNEVIAFAVQDTGIGIPKAKQQIIFEAFQQADTSTTRKYGGTGLGLAISRELAGLLGGEIRLESTENQGSTFTLYLPRELPDTAVPAAAPAQSVPEPLPSAAGNGLGKMGVSKSQSSLQDIFTGKPDKKEKSVLIIEDDKGFSQIVADFASHKKFKVYQAYTGTEGLNIIQQQQPDAVLLDIQLPDISGWDILQRISENPALRRMQVHVMSAYDKEVLGRKADAQEYIPKPVTLEMLDKAFGKIREGGKPIQKVMVIEDHPAENLAITELLSAHGIESLSALSGAQAFELLKTNTVDCIILDLNLPDMGGYEVMEQVRSTSKNLPIIVYSGKDLSEEEEFKLKKYANTIIIKNQFSYIRLLDEVQLFLHKINERLPVENSADFKMKLHIPEEILKNKKVLVVDDDVRNVYSLLNLLEQHHMKIVVANDGKEALQKVETEKGIDLVLMDVMMPEMDGIEATRRIRQNPAFAKLPIIALTAKAMKGDKEKCIQAGASDYISKPIDVDKLLALMRVWLYEGV